MGLGGIIGMALSGLLVYKQSDMIADRIKTLRGGMPSAEAVVRMNSFQSSIELYLNEQALEGNPVALPENFADWLDSNFRVKDGKPAGTDPWGNRFQGDPDLDGFIGVRCCGADSTCRDSDDLVLKIWKK